MEVSWSEHIRHKICAL